MKPRHGGKPSLFMKSCWRAEYFALLLAKLFLACLPWKARIEAGRSLGRIIFRLDRKHRRVSLNNLAAAFPRLEEKELSKLSRSSFENIGKLMIEVIFQKRREKTLLSVTTIEGWENLHEASRDGRGYILVSGHFGNWEWVAYIQGSLGFPLEMVTRPLDNPYAEKFLKKLREARGNRVIYKRNAVKEMVKALKAGKGVAFVFDQNFGEEGGVFVPFFGRPAATTPVFGRIAARMEIPVVPVMAYPEGCGYRIVYQKPIFPDGALAVDENSMRVIESSTRVLEDAVRKEPGAWFWMHDRWRTRPKGEVSEELSNG